MARKGSPDIAFLGKELVLWTGGVDFLRLCISGIDSVFPNRTWPVLTPIPTPTLADKALNSAIKTKRTVFSWFGKPPATVPSISKDQVIDSMSAAGCSVNIASYKDSSTDLASVMDAIQAKVVLPCMTSLGPKFRYAWIGYIGDIQHRHFPENFSARERVIRERRFKRLLSDAGAVIVNSRSVAQDINKFYPEARARLFPLPFCPLINQALFEELDPQELRQYSLPERYFLISNQFWVHKSHATAFNALRRLHDDGLRDIKILCTGNVHDYRFPGYVDKLKRDIARNGLDEHICFLGVIPKKHQLAIMRGAVALIQPTLFEGGPGGGALYDAISVGTPAILSDIDVNLEADCGVMEFFHAGSDEDIALKMKKFLESPPARLKFDQIAVSLQQRRERLGATLLEAIDYVAESVRAS